MSSIPATQPRQLTGILLAAGRARRMGRTKQLLPWPPDSQTPLVAAAFDAVAPICATMVVVLGHDAPAVAAALAPRAFTAAHSDSGAPMFESIRAGLAAAAVFFPTNDILLHPGDHPTVHRATLDLLLSSLRSDPARAHMPEYNSKGGHPVLIPVSIADALLKWNGAGGLRQFWLDHPHLCTRHPVDDPGVTFDIDTPPDYHTPRVPS